MTRYLSGISEYYGCKWKDKMSSKEKIEEMSNLLMQREEDYRKIRLQSLFEYMYEKDATDISQGESYSPSVVRKARAMTVPPLQDIFEDTLLYPSKWVSPSLTRKDRRQRLKNQGNKDCKNKLDVDSNNNNIKSNKTNALKTTEAFNTRFYTPHEKRKQFSKHVLGSLPEDAATGSFDEETTENHSNKTGMCGMEWNVCRPRSWSS